MSEPGKPPAILVVEDESLLRTMAVDIFEAAGFHVLDVPSGEQALELLDGQPVRGLFTDVELSGPIDGIELAKITHVRHPGTVIVVVSGRRKLDEADLPPGATFIAKPYDGVQVVRTLERMIGGGD